MNRVSYDDLKPDDVVLYVLGSFNGETRHNDLPDTLEMKEMIQNRVKIEAKILLNYGAGTLQLKLIGLNGQIRNAIRPADYVNHEDRIWPDGYYELKPSE